MWRQSHNRAVSATHQVRRQMERAGYRRADAAERAQFPLLDYVHKQRRKGGKGTGRVVMRNGMVVNKEELLHHVSIEACDELITSGTLLPTPPITPSFDEEEEAAEDADYVEASSSEPSSVQPSRTTPGAASSSPTKQNRGIVSTTLTYSLTHSLTNPLTHSVSHSLTPLRLSNDMVVS